MAHITANSLLQRPSPTLVTIPRECLLLIVERLPFQSLLTLAQASRYLSVIASEPTLWIHLSLRDYNHDPTPYLSTNSAFPFKSPKQVYLSAFVRWAPKYGIWQGDFPFYEGEMVVVRPNFDRGEINFWLIRGENRSRDDEDDPDPEAPFSKDRNVMVDLFDVGVEEDEILSIGFGIPEDAEQDIEAMGYRVEIMGPTEAEKARMTKWEEDKRRRNLENKGQIGSFFICGRFVPPHPHASVVTLKELMQNTENRGL
ncbi:hypothetical protein HK097_002766 [Rhizophlyctis rosea]|uniref:F-box domain-containing protein n=1 Tax=Rhizophlyctis rosea TaxID=64517 RepID=A0AAD5SAM3_9FUNG|nr:hypothetical protein HK097_002766 [Rhizophlyctis rosea]